MGGPTFFVAEAATFSGARVSPPDGSGGVGFAVNFDQQTGQSADARSWQLAGVAITTASGMATAVVIPMGWVEAPVFRAMRWTLERESRRLSALPTRTSSGPAKVCSCTPTATLLWYGCDHAARNHSSRLTTCHAQHGRFYGVFEEAMQKFKQDRNGAECFRPLEQDF